MNSPETSPLVLVDLGDLMTSRPPRVNFAIDPLLPRRHVTLMAGHGGTGKTILALSMAVHVAAGIPFAGLIASPLPVLFVSLEDEPDVIRLRLRAVLEELGLPATRITASLRLFDGTQHFAALVSEERNAGSAIPTDAFHVLREEAHGAGLIIIDNASDAFDANENCRRSVRAFIRALAGIARENDAAVLLLAHVDKSAAKYGAMGNTYSGSTAWHNSCRSRLALTSGDDGRLILTHEKFNHGTRAEPIGFRFSMRGVPGPAAGAQSTAANVSAAIEAGMMNAFRAAEDAGITIPANLVPGAHSAMTVLSTLTEYPAACLKGREGRILAAQVLQAMKRRGAIQEKAYTKENRHKAKQLVLSSSAICVDPPGKGQDGCAGADGEIGSESALRHPLIPSSASTQRAQACVTAPKGTAHDRRTSDASAHAASECIRCNGEGCAWCPSSDQEAAA